MVIDGVPGRAVGGCWYISNQGKCGFTGWSGSSSTLVLSYLQVGSLEVVGFHANAPPLSFLHAPDIPYGSDLGARPHEPSINLTWTLTDMNYCLYCGIVGP